MLKIMPIEKRSGEHMNRLLNRMWLSAHPYSKNLSTELHLLANAVVTSAAISLFGLNDPDSEKAIATLSHCWWSI